MKETATVSFENYSYIKLVENAQITKYPIRSEPILHSEIGFQNQNQ